MLQLSPSYRLRGVYSTQICLSDSWVLLLIVRSSSPEEASKVQTPLSAIISTLLMLDRLNATLICNTDERRTYVLGVGETSPHSVIQFLSRLIGQSELKECLLALKLGQGERECLIVSMKRGSHTHARVTLEVRGVRAVIEDRPSEELVRLVARALSVIYTV